MYTSSLGKQKFMKDVRECAMKLNFIVSKSTVFLHQLSVSYRVVHKPLIKSANGEHL